MLDSVIALVADESYLPHAKSVMVNCRREGQWTGDFCLIIPSTIDPEYFTSRGIYVLQDDAPVHYRKFALFNDYFNQQYITEWETPDFRWDTVLYLDCDVLVQNPLEPLTHEVGWGTILADQEMFTLRHAFTNWAPKELLDSPKTRTLMNGLETQYDLDRHQFCTAIMLWHPRTMPPKGQTNLAAMRKRLAPINTHVANGTDQPIINLAYYGMFERVRSDLFCYYESAWEKTIAVHYCSGYAQWIEKGERQNAYFNERLGRPCHDIYLDNLAAFEDTFPVIRHA